MMDVFFPGGTGTDSNLIPAKISCRRCNPYHCEKPLIHTFDLRGKVCIFIWIAPIICGIICVKLLILGHKRHKKNRFKQQNKVPI